MHRTRTLSRCTLIAVLAIAGLPGLLGCADPAADKPAAEVDDAVEHGGGATGGERFVLTDESSIGFTGSKVTGSHDGGFNDFDGEIMLVGDDPTRSSVSVNIDTTSIWTDTERLTGHLKSADFFEVETYPMATFESTAIEAAPGGYTITGNLDLHGVEKSITFPAVIEVKEDQVVARAEFSIKRFDFGIEFKGKADDLIRDDVVIRFDLIAEPESEI